MSEVTDNEAELLRQLEELHLCVIRHENDRRAAAAVRAGKFDGLDEELWECVGKIYENAPDLWEEGEDE
jgi:hypothetical protein